jgi:N-acetylglucosaminyl-diphospho-decaprenol L-rhamnosyltransferase
MMSTPLETTLEGVGRAPHGADYELVAVSYLSVHNLSELLARLPADLPIVVVDNARNADGARELVESRPRGRYLDSGGGKGYTKAANLGLRSSTYEYVIFINPDSRPTVEVFDALVDQLRTDPKLGAIAALSVGADGRTEIGVGGWEPSVMRAAVHASGLHKRFPRHGLWAQPEPGESVELDWLSGGCMAVRRQTLLDLGGFDERYFVYNEDMTFGRSLRRAGYLQRLRTDLLVPHAAGSSGGGSTNMARLRGASMVNYVRRHNSLAAAMAIRVLLLLGTVLRIVQSAARRDAPRAAMFGSYANGLLFGTGRLPGVPDQRSPQANSTGGAASDLRK